MYQLRSQDAWESRVRADFGDRLGDLISEQSLRMADLSRMTGVSYSTVKAWRDGTREPRLTDLLRLASALDRSSVEDLIGPAPSARLYPGS